MDFFSNWPNPHFSADLVTLITEETRNGKLHFLCSGYTLHACEKYILYWKNESDGSDSGFKKLTRRVLKSVAEDLIKYANAYINALKWDIFLFLMCKVTRCALAKDTNKGLERSLQVACFEQLKKNIEEQVLKNGT